MKKISLFIFLLSLVSQLVVAQGSASDTFWVYIKDQRAMVGHQVKAQENLYTIAQQYSVPALVLSQNNDISFYEPLKPGQRILIPLGNYNYIQSNSKRAKGFVPIYYKAKAQDTYYELAQYLGIREDRLQNLNPNQIEPFAKARLLMGWLACQVTDDTPAISAESDKADSDIRSSVVSSTAQATMPLDTPNGPPSELEKIYNYQTNDELYLDSLNGMVAFFKPQTSVNDDMLFAFSDDIPRGKVVKVVNPSNDNFVFAKVIGALPKTKQYINAKIGLDGRARKILDTREIKLWCSFYFKY